VVTSGKRARNYADALAALRRWQETPYMVWRRPASDPTTRARIGQELSDSVREVTYHARLLRLESDVVGEAFKQLWDQIRLTRGANRRLAWRSPLITTDEQMADDPPFEIADADPEFELCTLAMRRELSLWSPLLRWDTRRRLRHQDAARGAHRQAVLESRHIKSV
jgi:hypothetical protein